jgi:hypothetical protein
MNKLKTFERKIMSKMCGPTGTDDGYCSIKTNREFNDLVKGQKIIEFIKKQRLNWLEHVERMTEDIIVQKVTRWKPTPKRPTGRPKMRWKNDVLEDVRSMNVGNWKNVAQNRDSWKKVVERGRTVYRLWRFGGGGGGGRRSKRRRITRTRRGRSLVLIPHVSVFVKFPFMLSRLICPDILKPTDHEAINYVHFPFLLFFPLCRDGTFSLALYC